MHNLQVEKREVHPPLIRNTEQTQLVRGRMLSIKDKTTIFCLYFVSPFNFPSRRILRELTQESPPPSLTILPLPVTPLVTFRVSYTSGACSSMNARGMEE